MNKSKYCLTFAIALSSGPAFAGCEELTNLKLPDVVITAAKPAEPFSATDPMFGQFEARRRFCRVAGVIAPAIRFEVWLPEVADWNGKLQGVGNGGVAGSIAEASLAMGVNRGYAAVSSNLGHDGNAIDFRFAVGHPELVADWGYRATHAMTVTAKQIVAAYYGKAPTRSYFTGCSGGGRQGLMEAQRFPADYDGIVAGDPTADFTRLTLGGRLWGAIATLKEPASYIPASKIPAIARATAAACADSHGVIDDPRGCRFDAATLLCKTAETDDCLTKPQVAALKSVYAGAINAKGEQIFPGYLPGGELGPGGWASYLSGDAPKHSGQFRYADAFARYMVMENPDYDSLSFDFDRDMPKAIAKLSPTIDAADPDLSGFDKHGGKLIQYHGWSDPGVSPLSSVNYYEKVERTMKVDPMSFYRLFMVPGMQHCVGGPGADHFDALSALEQWVEQGEAPDQIVAAHMTGGKIDWTRPLCPYPEVARWSGSGTANNEKNFACVSPGRL
jgi:feruloyl esterase